ncbi:MAG: translation initiation factor IF-6 [Candidatus Hodarchaeales archaeon]
MEIELIDYLGSIHIGVAMLITEEFAFVPNNIPESLKRIIQRVTQTKILEISENIIGSLMVGNSKGLVVSNVISQEVLNQIKKSGLPVYQSPEFFAFGNVILANDFGGIISPIVPPSIRKNIAETLDVPIETKQIANSDLVGSLAFVTNHSGLFTPLAEEKEITEIKKILQLKETGVGSVNKGSEFVASGLLGNSKGLLVGKETTGIEIMEISRCF